jgi:hypothetical protein
MDEAYVGGEEPNVAVRHRTIVVACLFRKHGTRAALCLHDAEATIQKHFYETIAKNAVFEFLYEFPG